MTIRYDRATGCTGGPTPGATAVAGHWRAVTGLQRTEIYNCRRIRGGNSFSIHAEGRAIDLFADAFTPHEADAAERYIHFLTGNAVELQMQYLIWNRRSWKHDRGWRRYQGASPHTNHIHVELNKTGANNITRQLLDGLWQGDDMTDLEFVLLCYTALKLTADRPGVAHWTGLLGGGHNRQQVWELIADADGNPAT